MFFTSARIEEASQKSFDPGFGDTSATTRWRNKNALRHDAIETSVSRVFGVPIASMRSATRGRARVALARQSAMYLAHVVCGLSLTEVGRIFERDRTTVAHACALIEDRRDDPFFDQLLELLERVTREEVRRRFGCDEVLSRPAEFGCQD
jgi:Bacterial dnaA protein helix-turn-helix